MDSEKPDALRSLLTRVACILGGLLLMYVPSFGPAAYIAVKYPRSLPLVKDVYAPLVWVVESVHLDRPFDHYLVWWQNLAGPGVHRRKYQTPPEQP